MRTLALVVAWYLWPTQRFVVLPLIYTIGLGFTRYRSENFHTFERATMAFQVETYERTGGREANTLRDTGLLHAAGRDGLSDPRIAAVARELADLALAGAAALPGFFAGADLDEAAAFFARYTRLARSPADDVLERISQPC